MKKILTLVALCFTLGGCLGGSDGGIPEPRPSGDVSGTAFDGLILNGDVTVYAWNGKKGEVLGTGKTDNKGEYAITLDQVRSQPILIEVRNGRYTEEASGRNVPLRDGDFMYAVKDYTQGDSISTSLTFYTTIATGLAENMVRVGSDPSKAIQEANDVISDLIAIDIRDVTPLEIIDPSNATPEVTAAHLYGFATASISELTRFISEQNNSPAHEEYNSIKFAAAAYEDIAADGVLDGQGYDGIVSQGVVPLTTEMYRYQIATNMLVMANSDVNKTNLSSSDVLPMARMYNRAEGFVFPEEEDIVPMNTEAPSFTNISHEVNDVIAGIITFSASVVDTVGLSEVSLYIDGTLYEYQGDEPAPVFNVDTKDLIDGFHTFELYARNIVGGEARRTVGLRVSNAGTTISEIFPEDGSTITGTRTFSAQVTDPVGLNAVSFILDGAVYPLSATETPSKDFDLTQMQEGPHSLVVDVENSVGTKTSERVDFNIDNTAPSISWNLAGVDVMSGIETINATVTDNHQLTNAQLYISGALHDEFSVFPISKDINTRAWPEGPKTIVLEAHDVAGNTRTISENVLFDSTPPSVTINNPVSGETHINAFTFSADIYEAVAIDRVQLLVNNSHYRYLTPNSSGRVTTTITPSDWANNSYTFKLIATDSAGYTGQSGTLVHLAGRAPSLQKTKYSNGTGGNRTADTTLEIAVSNPGTGPYTIHRVWKNGSVISASITGSTSSVGAWSWYDSCDSGGFPDDYAIQVRDANGLTSNIVSIENASCQPW